MSALTMMRSSTLANEAAMRHGDTRIQLFHFNLSLNSSDVALA
jgi:hypothetical protein